MKKTTLFLLVLFPLLALQAQDQKPPKLRYTTNGFSVQYELGDKDVTEKEVSLHLEKTLPSAYYDFRRGQAQAKSALICNVIGLGGLVTGLVAKDPAVQAIGYGAGAVALTVGIVQTLSSSKNSKKAIKSYNQHFGY